MDILTLINEISSKFNIDNRVVLKILKETIIDELNLLDLIEEISNNKIILKEVFVDANGQKKIRVVKITKNYLKKIEKNFYQNLIDINIDNKISILKEYKKDGKLIKGTIKKINQYDVEIMTSYGKAFIPKRLQLKKDDMHNEFKLGDEFLFNINKVGKKRNKLNLILDRLSVNIIKQKMYEIFGYVNIYKINRKIGFYIKIYIDFEPNREDILKLKEYFKEQIIIKQI